MLRFVMLFIMTFEGTHTMFTSFGARFTLLLLMITIGLCWLFDN